MWLNNNDYHCTVIAHQGVVCSTEPEPEPEPDFYQFDVGHYYQFYPCF